MNTARHVFALILLVAMPPAVIFWLVAHPFAAQWRRLGASWAYLLLLGVWAAFAGVLFSLRNRLLGQDLGTNWATIIVGVALVLGSAWLSVLCKRQLRVSVFAGLPELSAHAYPGRLLQEGVYGVVRHPRYASVILGTTGFALAGNYTGAYAATAVSLLLLWPVIVLEERELAARFGTEYEAYRRRIPALLPRGTVHGS